MLRTTMMAKAKFVATAIAALLALGGPGATAAEASARDGKAELPSLKNGLVAHWKLDETTGATAADSSGNGNTATLGGATWTAEGAVGGALRFNGTDPKQGFSVGKLNGLAGGKSPHSITAWVKMMWIPSYNVEVLDLGGGQHDWYINYLSSICCGNYHGGQVSSPVDWGVWKHISVTYDGTTLTGYVDGKSVGTKPAAFDLPQGMPFALARPRRPTSESELLSFDGFVDDVRIYSRALSPEEVASLAGSRALPPNVVMDWWENTPWRYHLTFRNPQYADGRRLGYARGHQVQPMIGRVSSPDAPDDWMKPEFNDTSWVRGVRPIFGLSCIEPTVRAERLRRQFEVPDPSKVTELKFDIEYIGGAAVWLNGEEVARRHLPAGPLTGEVKAETYPDEAYEWGSPLPKFQFGGGQHFKVLEWAPVSDPKAERWRKFSVKLDPKKLRKGTNLLAISLHQSGFGARAGETKCFSMNLLARGEKSLPVDSPSGKSAVEASKGRARIAIDKKSNKEMVDCNSLYWPHLLVRELKLSVSPPAAARPPKDLAGTQVWTEDIHATLGPGSACEAGSPPPVFRLVGAKNGTYSAQVAVGWAEALGSLAARAGDLTRVGGGGTIPAGAVRVRYGARPPGAGVVLGAFGGDATVPPFDLLTERAPAALPAEGVQPVWVTVRIPKDAAAGEYQGTLTFSLANLKPVEIRVRVMDFALPDPKDYGSFVGIENGFFSQPAQYKVPQWSEEYWKHVEKVVQWLGEAGNKLAVLPLVMGGAEGGDESIVAWIRKGDSYEYDWKNLDRYLDLVAKYWGTRATVMGEICYSPFSNVPPRYAGKNWRAEEMSPTVVMVRDQKGPLILELGSEEWKKHFLPFARALRQRLKEKGFENFAWGRFHDRIPGGVLEMAPALAEALPDVGWLRASHVGGGRNVFGKESKAFVSRDCVIFQIPHGYDKKTGDPASRCGWNQSLRITFPRVTADIQCIQPYGPPMNLRWYMENCLFHGVAGFYGLGADFWPSRPLAYSWFGVGNTDPCLLQAGPEGAEASQRFEALREGIQEAEVRIWLEKNGKDKAEPAKSVLDGRVLQSGAMATGNVSGLGVYYTGWQERSWDLYAAAAAAAGGQAPSAEDRARFFGAPGGK